MPIAIFLVKQKIILAAIHFCGYVLFHPLGWPHTPLHLAARYGHSEMVSLLLAGGANIAATDKVRKRFLGFTREG